MHAVAICSQYKVHVALSVLSPRHIRDDCESTEHNSNKPCLALGMSMQSCQRVPLWLDTLEDEHASVMADKAKLRLLLVQCAAYPAQGAGMAAQCRWCPHSSEAMAAPATWMRLSLASWTTLCWWPPPHAPLSPLGCWRGQTAFDLSLPWPPLSGPGYLGRARAGLVAATHRLALTALAPQALSVETLSMPPGQGHGTDLAMWLFWANLTLSVVLCLCARVASCDSLVSLPRPCLKWQ